jgi:hypothetical protein
LGLINSGERQVFVGNALTQPAVNAQWTAASGQYKPLNTGYFKFTICFYASVVTEIRLKKNGVTVSYNSAITAPTPGIRLISLTYVDRVTVANTEIFTVFANIPGVVNLDIYTGSSLTIERIDTL